MRIRKRFFFVLIFCILYFLPEAATAQLIITALQGGKISSQYNDSPSGEGIGNLIDNSTATKYLTFHTTAWVKFQAPAPYIIKKYSIASANDYDSRDPKSWKLEASNDASSWTILDSKSSQSFSSRFLRKEYSIVNGLAYSYYRLTMTSSDPDLQLSEWELIADPVAHDACISSLSAVFPHPLTAVSPIVNVKNTGASTESFPVTCLIEYKGTQVYKETVDVTGLAASSSQKLIFPAWSPEKDSVYTVTAWTGLQGDLISGNDRKSIIANSPKKVYLVGTAHLDLQWNWDLGTTITSYIPKTLKDNFALFEKYPDYKFTFDGAYRYMIMKEKYPAYYEKLKKYIASGQWNVGGSMVEACDVNMPSAESLMRQILYGNNFFKEEFGKTSVDIFLPDCFGFPYSLPTIASHCGLTGFSTQKFDRWGGFRSSPFSIGQWEGVDGSKITAVLKPSNYVSEPEINTEDVNALGASTGLYLGYDYYGVGDTGGSPTEAEVLTAMDFVLYPKSDINAVHASGDQIFRDMTPSQLSKLKIYNGELLMSTHGTGCYTAQANMKLLNRQNEIMANAAEKASVIAETFAGVSYPKETIKQDWITFLCHQFHDDLTGTSIPSAYDKYSLPDEKKALASFTEIRNNANSAVALKLDTRTDDQANSVPVVVYNSLGSDRYDISEATVTFSGEAPKYVGVYDKNGAETPSQIKSVSGNELSVLFMASVPANGYAVFQVKKAAAKTSLSTGMSVTVNTLENKRYKVSIDDLGDIASIYDKKIGKELLQSSSSFEVRDNKSSNWPAWEVLYEDVTSAPRSYVSQAVKTAIADSGAAQVSVCVTRSNEGSAFTHYYILTADTNGYVKVDNTVNWKAGNANGSLLKVSFPLTASNSKTTYDLGIGTIQRGINYANLYEVPGHQWADISNSDKSYGAAILNNCKYGWDKPAANIINLTLIHSPNGGGNYRNDIYVHNFAYAIYGHSGSWAEGNVVYAGERFNNPLIAFQTAAHADAGLGKSFSLFSSLPEQISVMSVKKAEYENDYIIRVREVSGKKWTGAQLTFPNNLISAREVDGMEALKGAAAFSSGALTFDIGPYQPKTFAVSLKNNLTTAVAENYGTVKDYELWQNYPNPFNPETVINYSLPKSGYVTLRIYDLLGREVTKLVDEVKSAGKYSVRFNSSNLSSGVYFYSINANSFSKVKKMMLLK